MLEQAEVMAFVATVQPERAMWFYRDVLGLKLVEDSQYAIVFDSNGTMLRIQKVQEFMPAPFTALGWKVSDIRATIGALAANGVVCERYPWIAQDDLGVWLTPDGSHVAWFRDPDGNILSLTQFT